MNDDTILNLAVVLGFILLIVIILLIVNAPHQVTFMNFDNGISCYMWRGEPVNCMQESSLP